MLESFFQATCLKPTYSLRRQLSLAFGVSAFLTLATVIVVAVVCLHILGSIVQDRGDTLLRNQVIGTMQDSSRYSAERFAAYMTRIGGIAQLIVEGVQDRIVGYPNAGWEEDLYVPFFDVESQTNQYPLNSPPLPMDWEIVNNVNEDNVLEHSQGRVVHLPFDAFSTAAACFYIQGSCDPSATSSSNWSFYEHCNELSNNMEVGGSIQPTNTTRGLYERSGDIGVLLKPLFEAEPSLLATGVFFHNSGAGASISFPGYTLLGAADPYTSVGCEWMKTINPHTGEPFGTQKEIDRCHTEGTEVPQREYNPMERSWCREMALNGDNMTWFGPFKTFDSGGYIIKIGKGIFDRRTGYFIGCATVDIVLEELNEFLRNELLIFNATEQFRDILVVNEVESALSIVRLDDSTILADTLSSRLNYDASVPGVPVVESGFISQNDFDIILNALEESSNPTNWEKAREGYVAVCASGIYSAYPVPPPPDEFDPDYEPRYLVIHSISNEVFDIIDELDNTVEEEVLLLIRDMIIIAVVGMLLTLGIVWCVSRVLTQPLIWMEQVAWSIVNHTDERAHEKLSSPDERRLEATFRLSPRTEILDLVSEFRTMIKGFSGNGASAVAEMELHEISNDMTWRSDFSQVYVYESHRRRSIRLSMAETAKQLKDVDEGSSEVGASNTVWDEEEFSNPSSDLIEARPVPRSSFVTTRELLIEDLHEVSEKSSEEMAAVENPSPMDSSSIVPAPPKRNFGPNIRPLLSKAYGSRSELGNGFQRETPTAYRSSLFWWILVLMVIPLLVTSALIWGISSHRIRQTVPKWIWVIEEYSVKHELVALQSFAALRASYAETSLSQVIRDLHLLSRFAGWSLFGGINLASTRTRVLEVTEDCKGMPGETCAFLSSNEPLCACEWKDTITGRSCTSVGEAAARAHQRRYFASQARDADLVTGARNASLSFPEFDHSSNTTLWWDHSEDLPGVEDGVNARGFTTSFDRLRVSSAMGVVEAPIYNYAIDLGRTTQYLGSFVAFESDGLFTGLAAGCRLNFPELSRFRSTDENGAASINSALCPLGKYGYDPRCRGWYHTGKTKHNADMSPVHITSPYLFASSTGGAPLVATSATSPVVNVQTGQYVGQTLLDFHPVDVRRALKDMTEPITFVITPEKDTKGGDTVIGPDSSDWASASITALLLPNGSEQDRAYFEEDILSSMKSGKSGIKEFRRSRPDKGMENITIAFAPVYLKTFLPLAPDDFSRGVNTSETLIYSVGIGRPTDSMRQPFRELHLMRDMRVIRGVYIVAIVLATVLCAVSWFMITLFITKPMLTLLTVVRAINARKAGDDISPLKGGSREVYQVYNTFSKLYKVVRVSNVAFFSGNLSWAYHFICDALKLFRKVGDNKAVGVACNNLGNTLHAMVRESRDEKCFNLSSGSCAVATALSHYDEAVTIAEREFEEESEAEAKAEFAHQLSDRTFNRGLFLLSLQHHACMESDDCKTLGLEDIIRSRELDYDVRDFWLERKLLLKKSEACFSRLLRRIHGLVDYYDDSDVREVWDVHSLVEEADQLLSAAWQEPRAPLFEKVTRIGRLQQLEAEAIRLDLAMDRNVEAARLAMRMFSEDENILEWSFVCAAKAILRLMREDKSSKSWSSRTVSSVRTDLRRMRSSCKHATLDMEKCLVFAFEINEKWEGDPLLDQINASCLWLFDRHCSWDDYVGVVAYTTKGDLNVKLDVKSENEGRQRAALDIATTSTNERACPSLPYAMQMLVDCAATSENDSYIVLVADGESWDRASYDTARTTIDRFNRERNTKIHVFVLGLELEDHEIVEHCRLLCSVTKASFYVDVTLTNVDSIFNTIARVVTGQDMIFGSMLGLTMEKF